MQSHSEAVDLKALPKAHRELFEHHPKGFGQRLEIDRLGMGLHDRILP